MLRSLVFIIALGLAVGQVGAVLAEEAAPAEQAAPIVRMHTNFGEIVLELDQERAPKSVANFLEYARSGHYENTIFHRVIDDFMIQGGGFTGDFKQKSTGRPIPNEADNGLRNHRGTIAMARTGHPHSATAQFFINVTDNAFLDHRAPTPAGWGYAVFGRVSKGMDVVDRIRRVETGPGGPMPSDVPRTPVIIEKVVVD